MSNWRHAGSPPCPQPLRFLFLSWAAFHLRPFVHEVGNCCDKTARKSIIVYGPKQLLWPNKIATRGLESSRSSTGRGTSPRVGRGIDSVYTRSRVTIAISPLKLAGSYRSNYIGLSGSILLCCHFPPRKYAPFSHRQFPSRNPAVAGEMPPRATLYLAAGRSRARYLKGAAYPGTRYRRPAIVFVRCIVIIASVLDGAPFIRDVNDAQSRRRKFD